MNYIGAKNKLGDFLIESICEALKKDHFKALNECVFCDLFAGSGAVSKRFSPLVKKIIANDREFYSFVILNSILKPPIKLNINVNNLFIESISKDKKQAKIFKHYALGGGENRQYFSDENAIKIDILRQNLQKEKDSDKISQSEYFYLLANLIESADKVANTASVYGAFLKKLKKSAQKKLDFTLNLPLFPHNINENEVYNEDSNKLILNIKGDILYLDPPYNSREYGANYHILNTIAKYDDFIPRGKTGLREYQKSQFCNKNQVSNALEYIIKNAKFKWIFLSYNDEGLLDLKEIENIFKKYGQYSIKQKFYQRFKADKTRTQKQDKTIEYLHILNKN